MRLFPVVNADVAEMNLSHKTILFILIISVILFAPPSFAQETSCLGGTCPPRLELTEVPSALETAMPSAEALAAGQKASEGSAFANKASAAFGMFGTNNVKEESN